MSFLNLIKFELKKLIISKNTWILLAIFVSLSNIFAFFLAGFLVINQASMYSFLKFLPFSIILFSFLISFSANIKESKKANTIKLNSLPINLKKLVLAKYCSFVVISLIFLALSSSYVMTIFYLGSPDYLLVLSGLLASLLFFMLCFAITSFTNVLSKSSFASLGYSIFIIFILALSGFGSVSTMLEIFLPSDLVQGLTKYSIISSYNSIASGFVGLNDLVLYLSLIAVFLLATIIYANNNVRKVSFGKSKLIAIFALCFMLNIFTFNSTVKFDLTKDKIYSISEGLVNISRKINKNGVNITFYYSESNKSVPVEIKRFANYVDKYLTLLEEASDGRIRYVKKDPELKESYEIEALRDKIAEIPLPNNDTMYAGISLRKGQLSSSIPYISIKRKAFLEYDIASLLTNFMSTKGHKKIGILTDLDLGNQDQTPAFLRALLKRYDIDLIPMTYPVFPMYDLVIAFVTPFTEPASLYATDQYLVKGGKLLLFLDPFFRTAPEDDFLMPDRKADNSAFDHLADLIRYYGVEYDYNSILADKTKSMNTNVPGVGVTNYPLWVMLTEQEMNKSLPIFANLNNIIIPEGGYFTPYDVMPTVTYTPLLTSSKNSQTVTRALFNTLGDPKAVASRIRGEKKPRDVSFMLDGNFISAFEKMPPDVVDWFNHAESVDNVAIVPEHIIDSDKKGVLVAIADMDFISDHFSTYGEKNIDGTISKKPISDNQFFLTNTIDYLMEDYDLISLRSKGDNTRTLEKVETLIVDNIAESNFQENALVRNIELNANQYETLVKRQKVTSSLDDYALLEQEIFKKQQELVKAKRTLKLYKRGLKESVESYARIIALINITFAPFALLILGFIYFTRRYFKNRK